MKQLIISSYDTEYNFSWAILENNEVVTCGCESRDLRKFDLWDSEYSMFSYALINKNNELIQDFDIILVCVNGCINFYMKGEQY